MKRVKDKHVDGCLKNFRDLLFIKKVLIDRIEIELKIFPNHDKFHFQTN